MTKWNLRNWEFKHILEHLKDAIGKMLLGNTIIDTII